VSCPSCGQPLPPGHHARCPHCAALVAGPVEGALAPSPQPVTPPAAGKQEPLREIPGLRKRERTWKDEVRERVRHRRQQRGGGDDLPLFRDTEEAPAEEAAPASAPAVEKPASEEGFPAGPRELGDEPIAEPADLPLRRFDPPPAEVAPRRSERYAEPLPEEEEADERPWRLPTEAADLQPRPPERPAEAGERAKAALVDALLILGVWAVVVYFAGRAARVGLMGLRPSWPYLCAYLAFLGLAYAACFTGVTGQTLGKMLTGLRVVNAGGRPPGFPRAFLRAAVGGLGVLLAFAGIVPLFFDPARRGLHDRLLKTRVVKG
jgi:uncharacterized RDD family membrane protein YckC